MTESDYQINELAKKAGVSVRTIRFYIDEGLLPPPPTQGRYASYSDEYLERLELIRLLKERFLPLKEIRVRLNGLSQEDVRSAVAQEREAALQQNPPPAAESQNEAGKTDSSALDYVNRLLKSRPPSSPSPVQMSRGAPKQASSPNELFEIQSPQSPMYPGGEEVWERIRLAPGVELHIQKPLETGMQQKLQRLLEHANRIFNR